MKMSIMGLPINYDPTQTTEFLPVDATFSWLDLNAQIINTGIKVGTQPFVDLDLSVYLPFMPILLYLRCTVAFMNVLAGTNAYFGIDRPPNAFYPSRVQYGTGVGGNKTLTHNCLVATNDRGVIRYVIVQPAAQQMDVDVWFEGIIRLRERT